MATDIKTPLDHFDAVAQSYEKSTGGCTREIAERLLPQLNIASDSIVLDSACGTGIVTDAIIQNLENKITPTIHAVDGAPKMVELVQGRFAGRENVHSAVMTGEALEFPDETFTHSITNLGLLFFNDPVKGAAEIFRTMKTGGIAVVTNWEELGYLPIIRKLQHEIHPEDEPFNVPIKPEWFKPSHTADVMKAGGFDKVELQEMVVHWAAEDVEGVAATILQMFGPAVFKDWSEEDKKKGAELLPKIVSNWTVTLEKNGQTCVGIKMKPIVVICRK